MWRVILALACAVWLCGQVRAEPVQAEPVSERQFTEDAAQAMKAATPGLAVDIGGDLQLTFRRENGNTGAIDLNNLYAAYRLDPARHDDLLKRIVASFNEGAAQATGSKATTPSDPQAAAAKLAASIVPTIKTRAWLDELKAKLASSQVEPVFDDLNKELVVVYAEDSDHRTRYLTSAEKLGVEREKMRDVAKDNLLRVLEGIKLRSVEDTGVYFATDRDYNSSMLLFDEMWSGEQLKVEGDFVVAVPVANAILVTGSKNRKGLKVLRQMTKKWFAEGPHSISENLFVRRNGKFAKYGR